MWKIEFIYNYKIYIPNMFTDLFLNPNIYNKEQRKNKINELCSNNILLKKKL